MPFLIHFKQLISLSSFSQEEVKRAEGATNQDFPEGGFDGLMQAIVCEKDIKWRNASVRVIFFSTDAGFHFAGDGKVRGKGENGRRSPWGIVSSYYYYYSVLSLNLC